jgi:hypothetical protein
LFFDRVAKYRGKLVKEEALSAMLALYEGGFGEDVF